MADWEIFGQSFGLVVETIIRGILQGGLYSLIALGIVVINKASGIFNFAHGWMMFFGAMLFWQFYANDPSAQLRGGVIVLAAAVGLFILVSVGISTRGTVAVAGAKQNALQRLLSQWQNNQIDKQRFVVFLVGAIVTTIIIAVCVLQDSSEMVRASAAALIGSIVLGLLLERFTIRPLLGQPVLTAILMTLAIGFMLQGASQIIWGTVPQKIDVFTAESTRTDEEKAAAPATNVIAVPVFTFEGGQQEVTTQQELGGGTAANYRIKTESWLGRDIRLPRFLVWGFFIAIVVFVAFTLFFQYTSLGLAMRATAENQVLAESVGLQVRWTLALSWAMVAVMATMAGVVQGTGGTGVDIAVVPLLALVVFPAVLLGGLESITGAMVGGLVIGVVEKLTTIYVDTTAGQQLAPFVVLIIVLIIRPDGLFGQRRIDRV
ncbi:MAG: hypothetical protein CUN55_11450 [Phototrophicales bacterium]|nr:MAG: hypothetical protein CUN55_11450 [Phototrophicales bacterium]